MTLLNGQRHGFDGTFGHPSRRSGGGVGTLLPVYDDLRYATEPVIGVSWHPIDANVNMRRPTVDHLLLNPRMAPRVWPLPERGLQGSASGALVTVNPSPFSALDLGASSELI